MNLSKSQLIAIGEVPNIVVLAADLGCQVGFLPIRYLGLALGTSFKNRSTWHPMIDKMRKKLAGWKANYLSRGGRITLIKATLASIPIYFLSLFVIPSQAALQLEKIQRDFLWKGSSND